MKYNFEFMELSFNSFSLRIENDFIIIFSDLLLNKLTNLKLDKNASTDFYIE